MIFIGIDCGTQSTKTVALDWHTGEILTSAQKAYDFVPGLEPGAMEQNPEDWASAAEETIGAVLTALGTRRDEVLGIGVSGQQHGLVALDGEGRVVRPAKLWCDTSTAVQCGEITDHFGGTDAVISLVGNAMLPGWTAPKILWLRENESENWKKTRSVLLPHDYLNFHLTGVQRMEYGDASGTGLLDVKARQWSGEMLSFIGADLEEKLPPLGSSADVHGVLKEELRLRWGLSQAPVVSAGGGDNMIAAIGTGNVHPGVVTASLGTSGTLFAFSKSPVVDPVGEVAAFCDSTDNWLPLVCTMNVTLVTELTRGLFNWTHDELDSQLQRAPAGSDGLVLLPYLAGERTPNLPHGTGVLYGLTTRNFTREHLARAAVEGVTLGLGYGLQRFRELGVDPSEIRLTGGGSNSRAWRQICADIFGVPTVCLRNGEGAGLGAAMQAGWAWSRANGQGVSLADIAGRLVQLDESSRTEPSASSVESYRGMLAKAASVRQALLEKSLL